MSSLKTVREPLTSEQIEHLPPGTVLQSEFGYYYVVFLAVEYGKVKKKIRSLCFSGEYDPSWMDSMHGQLVPEPLPDVLAPPPPWRGR